MDNENRSTKTKINTIAQKNRIVSNIGGALLERDHFLLLGHKDPETDCIAALVSLSILLTYLHKEVTIFFAGPVPVQYSYFLAICKYNGVSVVYGKLPKHGSYSTVVVVDTAKPEMLTVNEDINALLQNKSVCKIEIDHHLGSDSFYNGDITHSLVDEAASTCELVGYLMIKLEKADKKFNKLSLSRNLILAIFTGIVSESQMGKYLKTRREKRYYDLFVEMFYKMAGENGQKNKIHSSIESVFDVIKNFSVREKHCYDKILEKQQAGKSMHYVCLDSAASAELFAVFGDETIVNVAKAVVNSLAETFGNLGLVVYYDDDSHSNFIQFRLRRSVQCLHIDMRSILTDLGIQNGGGHPGAVGFRIEKKAIQDIHAYTADMVSRIETIAGL
jgi:nanoRNase/pAp phosphatase (c-di-AMP/oligoRNAs hydrolase)